MDDKPREATFAEKRAQWLNALTGDDRHSIHKQLAVMTWDTAAYKVVNEARRLAPAAPDGGVQLNGLVHRLLDRCFFASQALAVRRLVDPAREGQTGKMGVYSLHGLIEDMSKNAALFTRESILAAEGIPYHFEHLREQDFASRLQRVAGGTWATVPNTGGWEASLGRHEAIDRLTNTGSTARKPGDVIPAEKFATLKERIVATSEHIKTRVDKFYAHAATPESRASVEDAGISLKDLWDAHEMLCRVASCIATDFLGGSFTTGLAVSLADQFEFIDRALVRPEQVGELRKHWADFADKTQKWNTFAFSESDNERIEKEHDGIPD